MDSGLSGMSPPPSPESFSSPAANASQNPPLGAAPSPGGLLDMSQPAFDVSGNTSGGPMANASPPQAAICPSPQTPPFFSGPQQTPPFCSGPQQTPPSCGGPPRVPQSAGTPQMLVCPPQPTQQQEGDIMRGRAPPSPTIPYTRFIPNYPAQSSPLPQPGGATMRDIIISGEERARQPLNEEERQRLQPGLSPVSPGPPYNQFNFLERPCMMGYTEQPQIGPRGTPPLFRLIAQPPDSSFNIPPYSPSPPFKIPYYNQTPNTPIPYLPSPGTPGQQRTPPANSLNQTIYDPSNRIIIESPVRELGGCAPLCPTCSRPVGHSYYAPNMSATGYSCGGPVSPGGNTSRSQGQDGLLCMTPPNFQDSCNQSLNTSAGQRSLGPIGATPQTHESYNQPRDQPSDAGRRSDPSQGVGMQGVTLQENTTADSTVLNMTIPNASQVVDEVGNQWNSSLDASPGSNRGSPMPASEASPAIVYFPSPKVPKNSSEAASSGGESTSINIALSTPAAETGVVTTSGGISMPSGPGLHIDVASGLSDSDDRGLQILQTKGRRSTLTTEEIADIEAYLNSHVLSEEQIENVRQMLIARGCNLHSTGRSSLGEGTVVVPYANTKQQTPAPANASPTPPSPSEPQHVTAAVVESRNTSLNMKILSNPETLSPIFVDESSRAYPSAPPTSHETAGSPRCSAPESASDHGSGQLSSPESFTGNSAGNGPVSENKRSPGGTVGTVSSDVKESNISPQISPVSLNSANYPQSVAVEAQLQNGSSHRSANDTSSFFFSPENSSKTHPPQNETSQSGNHTEVSLIPTSLRRTSPSASLDGYPAQSTPVKDVTPKTGILAGDVGSPIPPMTPPIPYTGNSEIDPTQYSRYFATPENFRSESQERSGSSGACAGNQGALNISVTATPPVNGFTSNEPALHDFLYQSLTSVIQDLINDGKWPWKFCNCPCPEYPNGANDIPKVKRS